MKTIKRFLGNAYYKLFLRLAIVADRLGFHKAAWKLHNHVSYRAFVLMRGDW